MSRNSFISTSDLIHEKDEEEMIREQLFEKPLTPSDVGKLNRLVIPKQHAEKYFPLGGDSLLSFEDESGKTWRFRYSYWNSSQSYVLTKGWSRFVKEKQLDAGDVVVFQRRRLDGELCISWKRRSTSTANTTTSTTTTTTTTTTRASVHDRELSHQVVPNPPWTQAFYNAQFSYPSHTHQHHVPLLYQPACLHAVEPVIQTPMTTTMPVNSKRLRLFGVNLDCQIDDSDQPMSDSSSSASLLSQGRAQMAYSQGHGPDHNSYYYQY